MTYIIVAYLIILVVLLAIGRFMKNIDDSLKALIDSEDDK